MKKTLSIILSLVMLVCSVSSAMNVFAYTKSKAPAYNVGDTFEVVAAPLDIMEDDGKNSYFAKFTPTEKGYYEFVFDTKYEPAPDPKADASISMAFTTLISADDELVAMGIAAASSEDGEDEEEIAYPSCCGELKAGVTYYFTVSNYSNSTYTSNVTINKHTHHFYNDMIESYVDSENLKDNENGFYYTGCDKNGCVYVKPTKTIKKVKKITLSTTKYTYNGKEKKPSVKITDSKGNKIDKKNYKIKYSNNKKVGTAKVKITFKNEYEGTYTATYKINPKATSLKSVSAKKKGFTAKIKKQATQTSGYQIQYATNKAFSKNKKTVTVKGAKNTSKTVTGLKAGKKYYVKVRTYKTVNGKKYYSSWSKVKTVTTKR